MALSCNNVTTCSPRGQINLLVIAHLNISDNSFNINSEFAALPDFTFMHLFLFPHLNHTRDLEPAKLVYFKEDIFLLTPFRLDHPYFLSQDAFNRQQEFAIVQVSLMETWRTHKFRLLCARTCTHSVGMNRAGQESILQRSLSSVN